MVTMYRYIILQKSEIANHYHGQTWSDWEQGVKDKMYSTIGTKLRANRCWEAFSSTLIWKTHKIFLKLPDRPVEEMRTQSSTLSWMAWGGGGGVRSHPWTSTNSCFKNTDSIKALY